MEKMDALLLKKAFLAGAARISAEKEKINLLNVFPVPDGDTGTNMTLTILSAAKEVDALEDVTVNSLAKAISSGSLRGARGNSGVILSQLFRGFCRVVRDAEEIDVDLLAAGFAKATETAYKAVMKPKEGTILTVARAGSDRAAELALETDDIIVFCEGVLKTMEKALEETPELLPVLKEAGVVDSGGCGLLTVLQGAFDAICGKEVPTTSDFLDGAGKSAAAPAEAGGTGRKVGISADIETANIEFGYCTEFLIMAEKEFTEDDEMEFKGFLTEIGDCIVVVADDEIVKVHVHTNHPGQAIEKALTYGQLSKLKIDNMREEHHERLIENASQIAKEEAEKEKQKAEEEKKTQITKKNGFIAVSAGEGLSGVFKELGVDVVIEGGQTMNPSTDDMLNAIADVPAENVFIFPNNKNIILAANQAQSLTKDKNVIVVPSTTIPQGITALVGFVEENTPEENLARMQEEMQFVKTGEVTYSVRDTSIEGRTIHEGDIMGIGDDGILSVGQNVNDTVVEMLTELVDEESGVISLYYGESVSEEEAEKLDKKVRELYPDLDVEMVSGGQPVYYYIVSVE